MEKGEDPAMQPLITQETHVAQERINHDQLRVHRADDLDDGVDVVERRRGTWIARNLAILQETVLRKEGRCIYPPCYGKEVS